MDTMKSVLTVLLGRELLILLFGDPIRILQSFHHHIQILIGNITAGKKAADLINQRLRLLCALRTVLLCGGEEKLLVLIQKVVFFSMKQLCQLVIYVPLSRVTFAGFLVSNRSEGNSKSLRQFLLLQARLCAGFF